MRVLIRGAGFVNKGAEAMLLTLQAELRRRIGRVDFVVEPRAVPSGHEPSAERVGVRVLRAVSHTRAAGMWRAMTRIAGHPRQARAILATRHRWLRTLASVEAVDAVIDVCGYAYGDPWGRGTAVELSGWIDACRQAGRPYVFMPQAWGPFDSNDTRPIYRAAAQRSALLFARDGPSRAHLERLFAEEGVSNASDGSNAFSVAPDVAFRFNPADDAPLPDLPADDRPLIGLAPNRQVYRRSPGVGFDNRYVRELIALTRTIVELGARPILIPHEIDPGDNGTFDDRLLCGMIARAAPDGGAFALTDSYSAAQLKGVIGRLKLLIGSRYHALLAALSRGVPAVAIGWSHKYPELLGLFGLRRYALGHDEAGGSSAELLTEAWSRQAELRRCVQERLPAVIAEVDEVFDRTVAVLIGRPKTTRMARSEPGYSPVAASHR